MPTFSKEIEELKEEIATNLQLTDAQATYVEQCLQSAYIRGRLDQIDDLEKAKENIFKKDVDF